MIKQLITIGTLAAAAIATPASAQFTTSAATFTKAELNAVTSALNPSSLSSALDNFDAASPKMGHPRLFKGQADLLGIVASTKAERHKSLTSLGGYLKRNAVNNTVSDSLRSQINSHDSAVRLRSWWQQDRILEGMAESAVAWYMTGDAWYLGEMRARMNLFAPAVLARGCSGDVGETRDYAWYFALSYDFAYAAMGSAERDTVRKVLLACGNAGLAKAGPVFLAVDLGAITEHAGGHARRQRVGNEAGKLGKPGFFVERHPQHPLDQVPRDQRFARIPLGVGGAVGKAAVVAAPRADRGDINRQRVA